MGGQVRLVEVDLTEPTAPDRLVEAAGERIDVLVNNVGNAPVRTQGFLEITDAEWQATIDLNLLAAVRSTRAVLPHMVSAGRGSIVTIASVNATLADPAVIDYSAAKAALANFSKSISKEFGGRGIRANTISPGPVATDLWLGDHGVAATVAAQTGADPHDVVDQAEHDSVTGRFSKPSEIADLAVVLASERTANVTGADFRIDGGLIPTW